MIPDDAPVSITYAPTQSDLLAAFRARTWKPATIFRLILAIALVVAIASELKVLWLIWFATLVVGGLIVAEEMRARRVAEKQAVAAAAHGPTRYDFGDAGIHCERPGHVADYPWSDIDRVEESARFIFLVFPNTFALTIPKERLSAPDLLRLRSRLKDKLRDKAQLA